MSTITIVKCDICKNEIHEPRSGAFHVTVSSMGCAGPVGSPFARQFDMCDKCSAPLRAFMRKAAPKKKKVESE